MSFVLIGLYRLNIALDRLGWGDFHHSPNIELYESEVVFDPDLPQVTCTVIPLIKNNDAVPLRRKYSPPRCAH